MKRKFLNILLILFSLIGYLEWGTNNSSFLFQAEGEILSKIFSDPASVIHPFTLLPLAGQFSLFFSLFQEIPGKALTYLGIAAIGILFVFMFAIGLISLKFKILISTLPFLIVAFITIRQIRKGPKKIVH